MHKKYHTFHLIILTWSKVSVMLAWKLSHLMWQRDSWPSMLPLHLCNPGNMGNKFFKKTQVSEILWRGAACLKLFIYRVGINQRCHTTAIQRSEIERLKNCKSNLHTRIP